MFADLLPPKTLVFDWYLLGWPYGLIAFLFTVAALVALYFFLAPKFSRKLWAVLLCMGLFLVADYAVYFVGINLPRPRRNPPVANRRLSVFSDFA